MKRGFLALEDGSVFRGFVLGEGEVYGEVVFNTAMTGYQEVLTDPSYRGQIVVMTAPHVGNYGVNEHDLESSEIHVRAFVVRDLSFYASSWRAEKSLSDFLISSGVLVMWGVDTRAIVKRIRTRGVMKGVLSTLDRSPQELINLAKNAPDISVQDLVSEVSTRKSYLWNADDIGKIRKPVLVVDFGLKRNILRCLESVGLDPVVVSPENATECVRDLSPLGVVLSNGPGDPRSVKAGFEFVRQIIGKMPLLGICLGHQLISIALGGEVFKLRFGHHGVNHPVKDLRNNRVLITSQNHNYAVDLSSVKGVNITHKNLLDDTIEGFEVQELKIKCVQFHPEAAPGPGDAFGVFKEFVSMIDGC
ncbi:MAG: glutamine-hydrolyzing carbamoyl-phosphate synthase small subunit [Aquificaceae bacterium]